MLVTAAATAQLTAGPVELVSDKCTFSEGPLWMKDGHFIFSDPAKNVILTDAGKVFREPSNNSNGLTLDRQGRLIACETTTPRVTRTESDGRITVLAESYQGTPLNGPNDIVVRADGLILFTDPRDLKVETGLPSSVYALNPDVKKLTLLTAELKYPNGIALSPDEKTLYVGNTVTARIRAYDLSADANVSNGRDFCQVNIPDGMKVDKAGRIWTSSSKGIAVFGTDGRQIERVDFEGMPTNCGFGGADGKTLFITARKRVYRVPLKEPGIVPAAQAVK